MRASSRASGRTLLDLIEPDDRRRRVDRVHHVVERPGQRVDVLAVERRDEGAVQALDDLVGQVVALVLDLLDLVRLVPDRRSGASISSSSPAPCRICSAMRHEIVVEPLFARDQSERHSTSSMTGCDLSRSTSDLTDSSRRVDAAFNMIGRAITCTSGRTAGNLTPPTQVRHRRHHSSSVLAAGVCPDSLR